MPSSSAYLGSAVASCRLVVWKAGLGLILTVAFHSTLHARPQEALGKLRSFEIEFSRTLYSQSLRGDSVPDIGLSQRSGRPVLELIWPGHLMSLGSRPAEQVIAEWDSFVETLPTSEKMSMQGSFEATTPVTTRRSMPVSEGHLYLCSMMDTGAGRGRLLSLLEVKSLKPDHHSMSMKVHVLEEPSPIDAKPRTGDSYVRLYSYVTWGDPIRASYRFDLEARDSSWDSRDPMMWGDLFFGAEGLDFAVQLAPQQKSVLMQVNQGDLAFGIHSEAWAPQLLPATDALYALRLANGNRNSLILLQVIELSESEGWVDFSWTRIEEPEDLVPYRFAPYPGVLEGATGSSKLWHNLPFAGDLGFPFSLRSAESEQDGSFEVILPEEWEEPLEVLTREAGSFGRGLLGPSDPIVVLERTKSASLRVVPESESEVPVDIRVRGPEGLLVDGVLEDGNAFEFEDLPMGVYQVTGTTKDQVGFAIGSLSDDAEVIELTLALSPVGKMWGRGVDVESGRGVSFRVSAMHPSGWTLEGTAYRGLFSLQGFPVEESGSAWFYSPSHEPHEVSLRSSQSYLEVIVPAKKH